MTGQFTQQALQQGAYARQINPYDNRAQAEALAGNMINRGVGFAAPIAKFGMGVAGLDSPFGGAMAGAGMGAMFGGPLGAGIGAGVGAMAGTFGAAAQFTAGNFMQGMQQQQGLNMMMRQQYGFMRPGGGYGMTGGEMGQMGSQIRGMSHQVGQMGEMHSFGELASLAGNMGRMGFAQNVTDVKQFSQKFKQMVDTLKTVSKELGTSLQASQEMVAGMRQSGIFNAADQVRMAQGIRANNLAGISMESSSQMANIGSQISRSVGGLGRSGAFGGMRTIQQIGASMKTGALNEEDIYNATGLTGEQGQQALAQNQMASSAQFLKSGRGRYLLASLAGNNGQLNEDALNEFQSGGFGVGRTRQRAGQNLGNIGRANFLRNEGRLRGEVLNKLGGNVNTMALMGWAGERGIDIGAMGDREMLFGQRMLGMGRDEMDVAVKQANAMGDTSTFMQKQGMQDEYSRNVQVARSNTGLQGLKNTFNKFREHEQSKVQAYGAKAYQDVTNMVERQLNKLFGTYTVEIDKQLDDAYTNYLTSGGRDRSAAATVERSRGIATSGFAGSSPEGFGGGQMGLDQYKKIAQGGGMATGLASLVNPLAIFAPGSKGGSGAQDIGSSLFKMLGGQTMEDKTGFHFKFDKASKMNEQQQFDAFRGQVSAFKRGATSLPGNKEDMATASSLGQLLSSAGAGEALGNKQGMDRARAALQYAIDQGDPAAKDMLAKLDSGDPTSIQRVSTLVNASLVNAKQGGLAGATPLDFQSGGFATDQDRTKWVGGGDSLMKGRAAKERGGPSILGGAAIGAGIGAAWGVGIMSVPLAVGGALIGGAQAWMRGGAETKDERNLEQLGAIARSREGKESFFGAMGDDTAKMDKAKADWNRLQGGTKEDQESAEARFAQLTMTAGAIGKKDLMGMQEALSQGKEPVLEKEALARYRKQFGEKKTEKEIVSEAKNALGMAQTMAADERKVRGDALRKQGEMANTEFEKLTGAGVYMESGELRGATEEMYKKAGLGRMAAGMSAKGKRLKATADARFAGDSDESMEAQQARVKEKAEEEYKQNYQGRSSRELFQEAATSSALGKQEGETSGEYRNRMRTTGERRTVGREWQAAGRTAAQYGEGGAAAKWMGLNVDRGAQRRLVGAKGDIDKQMGIILGEGGEDFTAEQQKEIEKNLRITSGKKMGGYSKKDYDKLSKEEQKELSDIDAMGGEERAARGKRGLQKVAGQVAAAKEKDRQDKDPSLSTLKEMSAALKELAGTMKGEAATSGRTKNVHVMDIVQVKSV